jgi:hypothetical protein
MREQDQQYDSTTRHYSSTDNPMEPENKAKRSLADIKFTLTPAQSLDDLEKTEEMVLDLDELNKEDSKSLDAKLDTIRNNFTITV